MGPITDLAATVSTTGHEQIRFAATIVNIGRGDFILRVRRPHPFADWTIAQRIQEAGGGETERPTAATAIYGGDGHDHWHIKGVESHRLLREDGTEVGELVKQGFCFFDTDRIAPTLPGAPAESVHRGADCGKPWDVRLLMGLSVGWGDKYPWPLLDQRIPIDGLAGWPLSVVQTADLEGLFEESDETNNETWIDFDLTHDGGLPIATVVDQAPLPSASP